MVEIQDLVCWSRTIVSRASFPGAFVSTLLVAASLSFLPACLGTPDEVGGAGEVLTSERRATVALDRLKGVARARSVRVNENGTAWFKV